MNKKAIAFALLGLLAVGAEVNAQEPAASAHWAWRATLYGWFPNIRSDSQNFAAGGGHHIAIEADPGGYLSNLQFGFMGALEARRGRWSALADAIYLNLGDIKSRVKSISGPGGALAIPAQATIDTDLKGAVLTGAVGYSIAAGQDGEADAIFGLRHARIKSGLDWDFGGPLGALDRTGTAEISENFTDAFVGLRGRWPLQRGWFVPYYIDLGAGSSRFTWQALIGAGYRFSWGEASLVYRHLAYDFKSDSPISDLSFSGPALGLSFNF